MKIHYFKDHVSEKDALVSEPFGVEEGICPTKCWRVVRETMEEFAYRTAVTYTDNETASLYYWTTVKGISCHEVGSRDNKVDQVSVSREESRLYG